MAQVLCVIPARMASQRLPGKPLKLIHGKSLIQRVWEQASQAKSFTQVVIATDSPEIETAAPDFGAEVIMTSPECLTGSERICDVLRVFQKEPRRAKSTTWDLVLNVQGDMPFISPVVIDRLVKFVLDRKSFQMGTIATPITDKNLFLSPNIVKVVVGQDGSGLYFSRAPVPHSRDGEHINFTLNGTTQAVWGFKHMGLYAYRPDALRAYEGPEQSSLESVEKLEQLRILERGWKIGVDIIPAELCGPSIEVDTPEDLARAHKVASELNI